MLRGKVPSMWHTDDPRDIMTRVTCLVDNTVRHGSRLWGEHGLAFLIEGQGGSVLFDTGQSGTVLVHNLDELGVDLETVEAAAISHAHYDHTGGLSELLGRFRHGLPLYAHPDLFRERFSKRGDRIESIGLPLTREALAAHLRPKLSVEPQEIQPGVWTTGEITSRHEPEGRSEGHLVRTGAGWSPDPYRDDMSLVLEVGGGLALLCGCCHAGLLNTFYHVQRTFDRPIVAVAGGTHLVSAEASHLQQVSQVLIEADSLQHLYLNHCSGEAAFHGLLLSLGPDIVRSCPAGTQFDLEAH
jgi:7,8-dihydropterin-6-yl-methyl-4-(beta-D-ribofuranosyl)aminobenzene 5'-phosphate synthase